MDEGKNVSIVKDAGHHLYLDNPEGLMDALDQEMVYNIDHVDIQ